MSSGRLDWRNIQKKSFSLRRREKVIATRRCSLAVEHGIADKTTTWTGNVGRLFHRIPYCDNPIAKESSIAVCPRARGNATWSKTLETSDSCRSTAWVKTQAFLTQADSANRLLNSATTLSCLSLSNSGTRRFRLVKSASVILNVFLNYKLLGLCQ